MTTALEPLASWLDRVQPDSAHEELRLAMLERIAELDASKADLSDQRLLTAGLMALSANYLAALDASLADRKQLNDRVTALGTQVTTLTGDVAALVTALAAANSQIGSLLTLNEALARRVTALEARTLRGTSGIAPATSVVATGTSTVNVTFGTPMPTTSYTALVTLDTNATVQLGSISVVYPVTNKTKTGCTVTLRNSGLSLVSNVVVQVVALDIV